MWFHSTVCLGSSIFPRVLPAKFAPPSGSCHMWHQLSVVSLLLSARKVANPLVVRGHPRPCEGDATPLQDSESSPLMVCSSTSTLAHWTTGLSKSPPFAMTDFVATWAFHFPDGERSVLSPGGSHGGSAEGQRAPLWYLQRLRGARTGVESRPPGSPNRTPLKKGRRGGGGMRHS